MLVMKAKITGDAWMDGCTPVDGSKLHVGFGLYKSQSACDDFTMRHRKLRSQHDDGRDGVRTEQTSENKHVSRRRGACAVIRKAKEALQRRVTSLHVLEKRTKGAEGHKSDEHKCHILRSCLHHSGFSL